MLKLMRADFSRLFKSRAYWICTAVTFTICMFNIINLYTANISNMERLGVTILINASSFILFSSIFVSLFIGTDHACGTIRNKIIVGHSRAEIYLSNLIVCSAGTLFMRVLSWAGELIFGFAVGGQIGMDAALLVSYMLMIVMLLLSSCSIFTLIGVLSSSKSTGSVLCIMTAVASVIGGSLLEFYSKMCSEKHGEFLRLVNDIQPGGQAVQLEMGAVEHPETMTLYSLGVIAVITIIGLVIFRKKDLK